MFQTTDNFVETSRTWNLRFLLICDDYNEVMTTFNKRKGILYVTNKIKYKVTQSITKRSQKWSQRIFHAIMSIQLWIKLTRHCTAWLNSHDRLCHQFYLVILYEFQLENWFIIRIIRSTSSAWERLKFVLWGSAHRVNYINYSMALLYWFEIVMRRLKFVM